MQIKACLSRGSASCLYCGEIPGQRWELKAGKGSQTNELGVKPCSQPHCSFCVCPSCLWPWRVFTFQKAPSGSCSSSAQCGAARWERGPFLSPGLCWGHLGRAGTPEPPGLLGQAPGGSEWLQCIFSHLCLCCLMSWLWFCLFFFFKTLFLFYFNLSTCMPENV